VDVDSSSLPADSQPKLVRMILGERFDGYVALKSTFIK